MYIGLKCTGAGSVDRCECYHESLVFSKLNDCSKKKISPQYEENISP